MKHFKTEVLAIIDMAISINRLPLEPEGGNTFVQEREREKKAIKLFEVDVRS